MLSAKVHRSIRTALMTVLIGVASSPATAQTVIASPGQTVSTGAQGQQILFRDKTSITGGAESTITVRRAEYGANGQANVVIDVAKGAFRYVTGDTAGSHTIKTPLSTVGVRGTVIEGYVGLNGYELFALIEGAFEVCAIARCEQVTAPGTYVVVFPNGTISPPAGIPTGLMNAMLLRWPSVDLVSQYFFETVTTGGDPLVRFRDLREIGNGQSAVPPFTGNGTGGDGGSSSGGEPGGNPVDKVCRGKSRPGQPNDCRNLFPANSSGQPE